MNAAFTSASSAKAAILAGSAKITLVSRSSGARYTYKVSRAKPSGARQDGQVWFVSLLTGPDNEADFSYLGVLREGYGNNPVRFSTTAKSRMGSDAAPVKAISWAMNVLQERAEIPSTLEIWHEGCCCRCGRALTVPESIATGLGPECAKKSR
jgi:hypothetical protein